jgi:lipoate-protein ligase B
VSGGRLRVRVVRDLSYGEGLRLQEESVASVAADREGLAHLLLVEHRPVITLGRSSRAENVLAGEAALARLGVAVAETGRGGDVTYHGPGQLVAYPVLSLDRLGRDLHAHMRRLESWMIAVCGRWGIVAGRKAGLTGVWVGEGKIAAIGIAARRWIAFHGTALNIAPEMSHFALIVPCGIREHGVTSMAAELGGEAPGWEAVAEAAAAEFVGVFEMEDWDCERA